MRNFWLVFVCSATGGSEVKETLPTVSTIASGVDNKSNGLVWNREWVDDVATDGMILGGELTLEAQRTRRAGPAIEPR